MTNKELVRVEVARTMEELIIKEKRILEAGFKTHCKDAVNYYVIEVYVVSESAHKEDLV